MDHQFRILKLSERERYEALSQATQIACLPVMIHRATSREAALNCLQSGTNYDLLILDINTPQLNAEDTLHKLRSDPKFDHTPLIILIGDTSNADHTRLLELGANDFIDADAHSDILVARLKTLLRYKQTLNQLTRFSVDMDIFAAGVLHDVRNLESSIIAITELNRTRQNQSNISNQKQLIEDLSTLEDKADQLGKYANELIATVRATHTHWQLRELELAPLIEWAMQMSCPSIRQSNESPTWDIQGDLLPVYGDQHFLRLALLNIVQNAIKYRQQDTRPHISVNQRISVDSRCQLQKPSVITTFRDNGRGIAPSELRKIFEPFTRGSDSLGISGFGLGLALVLKVMTAMGGRAWAELPNDGASGLIICLELPTAPANTPEYMI